jgi:hypothetical protein
MSITLHAQQSFLLPLKDFTVIFSGKATKEAEERE